MDDIALISIFVALEGAHAFSAFEPSIFTIRKFARDGSESEGQNIANIRAAYLPSIALALGIGAVAGKITNSSYPFLASAMVAAGMIAVYEYALRGS